MAVQRFSRRLMGGQGKGNSLGSTRRDNDSNFWSASHKLSSRFRNGMHYRWHRSASLYSLQTPDDVATEWWCIAVTPADVWRPPGPDVSGPAVGWWVVGEVSAGARICWFLFILFCFVTAECHHRQRLGHSRGRVPQKLDDRDVSVKREEAMAYASHPLKKQSRYHRPQRLTPRAVDAYR